MLFSTLHRALVRTLLDTIGQKCFDICSGVHAYAVDITAVQVLLIGMQVNIPRAQVTERYPNLFRWFDFLQHTVDVDSQYTKLDIRKPKFQKAPAAPAPAAKVTHWLALF